MIESVCGVRLFAAGGKSWNLLRKCTLFCYGTRSFKAIGAVNKQVTEGLSTAH